VIRRVLIQHHRVDADIAGTVARLASGSVSRALRLAGHWPHYQALLARFGSDALAPWLETPLGESREEVADLLDAIVGWLRDLAAVATGATSELIHPSQRDWFRRHAGSVRVERCVETAVDVTRLRGALDQFVNPRLVGALARERYLSLLRPDARA
jgi:hypothetical protein